MVLLGGWLALMILEVFSNISFYDKFLQASTLLCYLPSSLVCVLVGEVLAVWLWVHCSLLFEQAIWLLLRLLDVTQSSNWLLQLSHLLQEVLHLGTPFAGRSAACTCSQEKGLSTFLQSEICSAASPFSSSFWVEASASSGVDGAPRAAAFALQQVPTILPWGSGKVSALDLWRWSQYCSRLLDYAYFKSPTCPVECPSFEEVSALVNCCANCRATPVWYAMFAVLLVSCAL